MIDDGYSMVAKGTCELGVKVKFSSLIVVRFAIVVRMESENGEWEWLRIENFEIVLTILKRTKMAGTTTSRVRICDATMTYLCSTGIRV